jgi:hypothetical protein
VARVELERLDAEDVTSQMPLPIRLDRGVSSTDHVNGPLDCYPIGLEGSLPAEPGR